MVFTLNTVSEYPSRKSSRNVHKVGCDSCNCILQSSKTAKRNI